MAADSEPKHLRIHRVSSGLAAAPADVFNGRSSHSDDTSVVVIFTPASREIPCGHDAEDGAALPAASRHRPAPPGSA